MKIIISGSSEETEKKWIPISVQVEISKTGPEQFVQDVMVYSLLK